MSATKVDLDYFGVGLDPEPARKLRRLAEKAGVSPSDYLADMITSWLRYKKPGSWARVN